MKKQTNSLATEIRTIAVELVPAMLAKYGRVLDAVEANRIVYPPAGYQKIAVLSSNLIERYWKLPEIAEVIVLSPALLGLRSNLGFKLAFANGLLPLPAQITRLWTDQTPKTGAI